MQVNDQKLKRAGRPKSGCSCRGEEGPLPMKLPLLGSVQKRRCPHGRPRRDHRGSKREGTSGFRGATMESVAAEHASHTLEVPAFVRTQRCLRRALAFPGCRSQQLFVPGDFTLRCS